MQRQKAPVTLVTVPCMAKQALLKCLCQNPSSKMPAVCEGGMGSWITPQGLVLGLGAALGRGSQCPVEE